MSNEFETGDIIIYNESMNPEEYQWTTAYVAKVVEPSPVEFKDGPRILIQITGPENSVYLNCKQYVPKRRCRVCLEYAKLKKVQKAVKSWVNH
jgi:hypothetical protein